MNEARPLEARCIAITGGARGIGFATMKELSARGARVVICDVDGGAAKNAAADASGDIHAIQCDVSEPESFSEFIEFTIKTLGRIDVLVNNAGIMPIGPFQDQDPQLCTRTVNVNLLGVLNGMRAVLPAMLDQGGGHIVNVASSAGRGAIPGGVVYCATKAAVVNATEAARIEFGSRGIAFTCVMPAFTNTELIAGTKGVRGFKNVEPEAVGIAIAEAIERKSLDAYVPRSLRQTLYIQSLIGRRLRDAFYRRIGVYDAFLNFDVAQRAAYSQRISDDRQIGDA